MAIKTGPHARSLASQLSVGITVNRTLVLLRGSHQLQNCGRCHRWHRARNHKRKNSCCIKGPRRASLEQRGPSLSVCKPALAHGRQQSCTSPSKSLAQRCSPPPRQEAASVQRQSQIRNANMNTQRGVTPHCCPAFSRLRCT